MFCIAFALVDRTTRITSEIIELPFILIFFGFRFILSFFNNAFIDSYRLVGGDA